MTPQDPQPHGDRESRIDPALIGDCVHCGFCLPTCPTYLLWGEEMDSPRGRIHLMGQHVEGTPVTPEMAGHFDACLGCMACVTACPSGVRYDRLIEQTRAVVEQERRRPIAEFSRHFDQRPFQTVEIPAEFPRHIRPGAATMRYEQGRKFHVAIVSVVH